ncbi:rho GTPase-activating protein 20-like [Mesocricetus auratus]|uniref:Rho GTPase-activating protein 20-like n=1 Tax=Mesocricetus auratus TaxID=10036 RepID=A0ABM2XXN4_MESAU|nr:rho GTPase-activating protein 20-like [Mesocricetus auratus]
METINEKATPSEGRYQALPLQVPVELRKGWKKKQRHLFLFSDVLIVSNNVHKKKFKVKYVIPLSYLWIGDYVDSSAGGKSIVLFWPMKNFVVTFRSREQKDQWHFFIQRYINEAKEIAERKCIALQINTKDIPDSTSACA